MIIFDGIGHMVSTESAEELHEFARKIGLKREWYQNPSKGSKVQRQVHGDYLCHYDLTTPNARQRAQRYGATRVSPEDIIRKAWWRKQ